MTNSSQFFSMFTGQRRIQRLQTLRFRMTWLQTYGSGGADSDGGGCGGGGRSLGDVGHRLTLLELGLSLGQNLLRDHDQLTHLRPDQDHT